MCLTRGRLGRHPTLSRKWYVDPVSGTYSVVMGDRGRLVVPAELRERMNLSSGSSLLLIETPRGILLVTRDQARKLVQESLSGHDLVAELLAERRRDAAAADL